MKEFGVGTMSSYDMNFLESVITLITQANENGLQLELDPLEYSWYIELRDTCQDHLHNLSLQNDIHGKTMEGDVTVLQIYDHAATSPFFFGVHPLSSELVRLAVVREQQVGPA